jgi:hypothetical protein
VRRKPMNIKKLFKSKDWANQEGDYYDPKLLLTDEEIQEIKNRNKDNEDVQRLLSDLETYKKIVMMYENT